MCVHADSIGEFADSPRFYEFKALFDLDHRNLLLAIYYDGFAPYRTSRRTSHGALYLVVMTMSCAARNRVDNLILLGFVPGPTKVTDIRVYLQPFIDDLKRGHRGVQVVHSDAGEDGCVI